VFGFCFGVMSLVRRLLVGFWGFGCGDGWWAFVIGFYLVLTVGVFNP